VKRRKLLFSTKELRSLVAFLSKSWLFGSSSGLTAHPALRDGPLVRGAALLSSSRLKGGFDHHRNCI